MGRIPPWSWWFSPNLTKEYIIRSINKWKSSVCVCVYAWLEGGLRCQLNSISNPRLRKEHKWTFFPMSHMDALIADANGPRSLALGSSLKKLHLIFENLLRSTSRSFGGDATICNSGDWQRIQLVDFEKLLEA